MLNFLASRANLRKPTADFADGEMEQKNAKSAKMRVPIRFAFWAFFCFVPPIRISAPSAVPPLSGALVAAEPRCDSGRFDNDSQPVGEVRDSAGSAASARERGDSSSLLDRLRASRNLQKRRPVEAV
jgi:hypothetical protein